jgi:amino acid permease
MDSEKVSAFFGGFFTAALIFIILMIIFFLPTSSEITRDIMNKVQQSTNIVEALKKEHLIIRDVNWGTKDDTAEIVVEYDFLYKNSMRK